MYYHINAPTQQLLLDYGRASCAENHAENEAVFG
jgi:hypothetical protein